MPDTNRRKPLHGFTELRKEQEVKNVAKNLAHARALRIKMSPKRCYGKFNLQILIFLSFFHLARSYYSVSVKIIYAFKDLLVK